MNRRSERFAAVGSLSDERDAASSVVLPASWCITQITAAILSMHRPVFYPCHFLCSRLNGFLSHLFFWQPAFLQTRHLATFPVVRTPASCTPPDHPRTTVYFSNLQLQASPMEQAPRHGGNKQSFGQKRAREMTASAHPHGHAPGHPMTSFHSKVAFSDLPIHPASKKALAEVFGYEHLRYTLSWRTVHRRGYL